MTIDPAVTRDAWQRLLAISADFHYARCAYGRLLERMYDIAGAEAQFREVISRADGDPRSQSMATDFLGTMARAREDWPAATSYFERSLELYRKAGDAWGERLTLEMLGHIAAQSGDVAVSETYLRKALDLGERDGDTDTVKRVLQTLAAIAEARGDADETARLNQRLAQA